MMKKKTDYNPIVNVGTDKTPMYVVDGSWLMNEYDKRVKKFSYDGYAKFSDKFIEEFNKSNDLNLTIKKVIKYAT